MLKSLLIFLVAFAGMAMGQTVQTPTLQGTYSWTGFDTFEFGHLGFSTTPPQCVNGQVVQGLTSTFGVNCTNGIAYNTNYQTTLADNLTSVATTVTLTQSTAGFVPTGCLEIDFEIMCYTSLDADGHSVDGVSRGQYTTTAASHTAGAPIFSVIAALATPNQPAAFIVWGQGGNGAQVSINNSHPEEDNPGNVFGVNSGNNETYLSNTGTIIQFGHNVGTCCNLLASTEIGQADGGGFNQDYISESYNVMQITNSYQTQQPLGLGGGIAGGVVFEQAPTIAAPTLQSIDPSGGTAYTYVCQDHAGLVPGTQATINLGTITFGITITCPRGVGVATYDLLRVAGGSTQGVLNSASNVLPGFAFNDFGGNEPTTPLAVITSNTSQAFISGLSYLSSSNLFATGLAISTAPLCVGTSHELTNVGCSGGSGGTVLSCSGGISCSLVSGTWDVTYSGSAGTGNVNSATWEQVGAYPGTGTTIGGAPNLYAVNPALSAAQMTSLFSRFAGATITSWSITSDVATFQSLNSYNAGDSVVLEGFGTSTFFNGTTVTVSGTGLSTTQFEAAVTHANGSATETGAATINVPQQPLTSQGMFIMPPGMIDNPSSAFVNGSYYGPAAQGLDWRKGFALQQASIYGVKCDAQILQVTLTNGSDMVDVGSSFSSFNQPIGMTMTAASQVGYSNTGTQATWTPTVIAYNSGIFPDLELSANSPLPTGSYSVMFGTNNQAALQRAFNDAGGTIPLWLPACSMLTDTIRWNGAHLIGQAPQSTSLGGFPGHDILQQATPIPITAWSINASTGVTTFTIPPYAAHSILPASLYPIGNMVGGDGLTLTGFGTSTFFNNVGVEIMTQPTPTTFTVNNAFGRSTSSGTEAGFGYPSTAANTNGLKVRDLNFAVNEQIDPSYSWTQYDQNDVSTVEPPFYRPLLEFTQSMNTPFGSGWGIGQVNGVANITQNSAVICVPTTGVVTPRIPTVGTKIIWPYQAGGLFSATVSSTAGSCSGSFTPITMSAPFPNTSGYTATQAEWFTMTTAQTLAVAMPGTISLPYTITLALPFPPAATAEYNVAQHGHIVIGTQQWDYTGVGFGGTAGGSPTIRLVNGPTSVNGGSGYGIGSVVFPLNPCQAMYNNPWPVVPTINSGTQTPAFAEYYAGLCGGNAAMALPMVDASATTFGGSGWSIADFDNVFGEPFGANAAGNQNANGSMFIYQSGNNTGYGNTFNNLRVANLWASFMQGPASVNQWGVSGVGPTSTGQTISNCTFRSGYHIATVEMQQSIIDRCDTYSTEVSQYDGTVIGSSQGLTLGITLSEKSGGEVTGPFQFTIRDYNDEPENGTNAEILPSVVSDCKNCTWIGNIFEGGYNIFGGSFQRFLGTQLAGPVFNYGQNNYFEKMYALNLAYKSGVTSFDGTSGFYNWGAFTTCSTTVGVSPVQSCGVGSIQSYDGHDAWATMYGNLAHPNENLLGGMISPDEFATNGTATFYDSTELWWGKTSLCPVGPDLECVYVNWGGFGGGILIGPHERITDTQQVLKMNVKAQNTGSFTYRIRITAQNVLGTSNCTPNFDVADGFGSATSTGWTQFQMPIDFTGNAWCSLGIQMDTGSASNVAEIGYANFVPFATQMFMPLGTPTLGGTCPVAGEFKLDTNYEWLCVPGSGFAFGAGTWAQIAVTK